jgi:hypothetical protein
MLIELTKVGEVYQDGKWPKVEIMYIRDGKPNKRTLVAINEAKNVVKALGSGEFKAGDMAEVEMVKSEDGQFWNWLSIKKVEKEQAAGAKTSFQAKSTYETPEERARKQVYIVRQSSISNAIDFLEKTPKATAEDVLALADKFVQYVFNGPEETKVAKKANPQEDDFKDDDPF